MSRKHVDLTRPVSAVHQAVPLVGVLGLAFGLWLVATVPYVLTPIEKTLVVCLCLILPMIAVDVGVFRVHRRSLEARAGKLDLYRVAVKLLGLYAVFGAIALGYWLFPEYRDGFYSPFFEVLNKVWIGLVVLAVPYVVWIDRRMADPYDGAWHAGLAVMGDWSSVDREQLFQFLRGWLVKAFFMPMMFAYLVGRVDSFLNGIDSGSLFDSERLFQLLLNATYMVDLGFATIGYFMTFRFLDSHVRSAEPTLLGWAVAIMCYKPFWTVLFYSQFFAYANSVGWTSWLWQMNAFHWFWAASILGLSVLYLWGELSFGLRFSNLTHRGILTGGPYRLTKHPAYVFKNISWWMIAVPFIPAGSWFEVARNCLLLFGVNVIYYLRARTEERHLAHDPVYVEYAQWMERHSIFRKLGVWFPRLFAFRWHDSREARVALGLRDDTSPSEGEGRQVGL